MIDRINNSTYTNSYTEGVKKVSAKSENAPAFLLNYDEKGVVWDRGTDSDKKSTEKKKESDKTDLYIKADREKKEEIKPPKESGADFSIWGVVKLAFSSIRNVLSAIGRFIWYGNEKSEEISKEEKVQVESEEVQLESEEVTIDSEPVREEARFVTEFERKLEAAKEGVEGIPARNTSLLTTYDRRGSIRNVSPSDTVRILKGDKSIKL